MEFSPLMPVTSYRETKSQNSRPGCLWVLRSKIFIVNFSQKRLPPYPRRGEEKMRRTVTALIALLSVNRFIY